AVMLNAGAAVMGMSETRGDNRARKAAEEALASPLLDNRDINGSKKILLSIISGADAELSMDELSEITEYIQQEAGDEAEMIFGHGVDYELGDRIRVTVIATGFISDTMKAYAQETERKVLELDRAQTWLFSPDNSVNERAKEITVRHAEPTPPEAKVPVLPELPVEPKVIVEPQEVREVTATEEKPAERQTTFSGPFVKVVEEPRPAKKEEVEKDGEEGLLAEEELDEVTAKYEEEMLDEERMMEVRKTRERLELEARERKEHLKNARKSEMTKEEFNEKWSLPAYLRRGVKMQNVPHSS